MHTDDPAFDWDAYCDMEEAAYRRLVRDKSCADCAHCDISPDDATCWGYCRLVMEYVRIDEPVPDSGCEDFQE